MRHRKNNNNRGYRYRSNGRMRQTRVNGGAPRGITSNSFSNGWNSSNFKSYINPEKLVEKYNTLAREALTSGDKILSENYFQHADHFMRIIDAKSLSQNQNKSQTNNESKPDKQTSTKDTNIKQDQPIEEKNKNSS